MGFFIVLAAVILLETVIPTLEVTTAAIAVIPSPGLRGSHHGAPGAIAAIAVIAATATFPTKAATGWFEGQGLLIVVLAPLACPQGLALSSSGHRGPVLQG